MSTHAAQIRLHCRHHAYQIANDQLSPIGVLTDSLTRYNPYYSQIYSLDNGLESRSVGVLISHSESTLMMRP